MIKHRNMAGIDKERIEAYFKGGFSIEEENYLINSFKEESNLEELKEILQQQWNNSLAEHADNYKLDHILHQLNYQINNTPGECAETTVKKLITWYARIAAILLIPILVYTGMITYHNRESAKAESYAEISAPLGSRIKFNLPDGSFGWLNSGSTMKYALNFNQSREVELTGEGFFDVKHDEGHKFVVKTKFLDIEVKGTAFNVAAYTNEDQIDISLERGSIFLKSDRFEAPVEMKPDDQVSYYPAKQTLTRAVAPARNFSAWKEGKLMLRNASLEDLARQLGRWYNVKVQVQNPQHADIRYRATFEDENLGEVLRLLKISSPLDYKIEDRVRESDGTYSKQTIVLRVRKSN